MKTLFSKHKWMQIIYGALLLIAGAMIIVVSINNVDNISQWLSIILAISLFIYASALLFTGIFSLQEKIFDIAFIYAIIFIAVGVVLVIKWELIGQFLTIFIATLLCGAGLVQIGQASAMVYFKRAKALIILNYCFAAIFITLGILAFSFPKEAQQVAYIGTGAIIAIAAIIELVLGIRSLAKGDKTDTKIDKKTDKSTKKDEVIDAEVIESDTINPPADKTDA